MEQQQDRRSLAGRTLGDVRRKLEQWRGGRGHPGGRIPEVFWAAAVALAGRHWVEHVAEALGLNRAKVEGRLGGAGGEKGAGTGASASRTGGAAFVEVGPLAAGPPAPQAWVLELEDGRGGRLLLRTGEGSGRLDLAGIVAAFRRGVS